MEKDDKKPIRYVTAALIVNDKTQEVYLIKRAREPFKDYWSLPGGVGFSREIDNPEIAVAEEIKGDLGCKFIVKGLVLKTRANKLENKLPGYFYYGNMVGKPRLTQRFVSDGKWFKIKEAIKINLAFEGNRVIEEYAKQHQ